MARRACPSLERSPVRRASALKSEEPSFAWPVCRSVWLGSNVYDVPFSLPCILPEGLPASLLAPLPNAPDFLVSPQCRRSVRPRERRRNVRGVPHREARAGDLLLISPRQVRDVAVLDANGVERFRGGAGGRRGRRLA